MIKQPSKPDKMYTVEVNVISNGSVLCENPCVYAQNPSDAVVYAMRQQGFAISRKSVSKHSNGYKGAVARVCLLGGCRESETYLDVQMG